MYSAKLNMCLRGFHFLFIPHAHVYTRLDYFLKKVGYTCNDFSSGKAEMLFFLCFWGICVSVSSLIDIKSLSTERQQRFSSFLH